MEFLYADLLDFGFCLLLVANWDVIRTHLQTKTHMSPLLRLSTTWIAFKDSYTLTLRFNIYIKLKQQLWLFNYLMYILLFPVWTSHLSSSDTFDLWRSMAREKSTIKNYASFCDVSFRIEDILCGHVAKYSF